MRRIERPAVVLLHCSGSTARQWEALVERLQPRFRALAVELHGHGARPEWSGDSPLALADDAGLVTPILERLGGAHVVGHSYGGAVALKLATMHPHLVTSLTAYEPVLFRALLEDPRSTREWREAFSVAESMFSRLLEGEPRAAAQRFVEYWSGADAWRHLAGARQASIAARMKSVVGHFDALFHEPFDAEELARLEMPLLFITGALTVGSTRRLGELLRLAAPNAMHEVLADMGHMGPITHADAVNARIEAFLVESHAAARSTQTIAGRRSAPCY